MAGFLELDIGTCSTRKTGTLLRERFFFPPFFSISFPDVISVFESVTNLQSRFEMNIRLGNNRLLKEKVDQDWFKETQRTRRYYATGLCPV